MCLSVAMLCKEQGITIAGVCALYEVFVAQKVNFVHILIIAKFIIQRLNYTYQQILIRF